MSSSCPLIIAQGQMTGSSLMDGQIDRVIRISSCLSDGPDVVTNLFM